MSMQKIIMQKIKQKFGDVNNGRYSWVDQAKCSNVGTVYFLDDDLANHGSFTYDFQDDNFTLRFFRAGAKPVHAIGFEPEGSLGSIYGKYSALPEVIKMIDIKLNMIFNHD